MQYMTMKQLASAEGVSYEAIRKQISAFHSELAGHITQEGKTKLLDEYAVQFLRERRRQSPVVVVNEERTQEEADLRTRLQAAQAEIIRLQAEIITLKDGAQAALETKLRYELAIEDRDRIKKEAQKQKAEYQARIDELTTQRDEAQAEAASYTRTWFGLYRKH